MIVRFFFAFSLAVAPLASAKESPAPPAETRRSLKFHRPQQVGDTYRYTAEVSQARTIDIIADDERQPGGSENLELSLEGTLEVTEVTPEFGNVLGMTFHVEKMSLTDEEGKQSGLEPGTVITAETDTVVGSAQFIYKKLDGLPENYRLLSSAYSHDTTTALPRDTSVRYIPSERSVAESKARFAVKQAGEEFELEIKTHLETRRSSAPQ